LFFLFLLLLFSCLSLPFAVVASVVVAVVVTLGVGPGSAMPRRVIPHFFVVFVSRLLLLLLSLLLIAVLLAAFVCFVCHIVRVVVLISCRRLVCLLLCVVVLFCVDYHHHV
jgi:hypothetical protein